MSVTAKTADSVRDSDAAHPHDAVPDEPATANQAGPRARHRRRRRLAFLLRPSASKSSDRLRLLAWSVVGIGCLLAAHWIQPEHRLLFALPTHPVGWAALLFGVTGLWLVPGLWLSALVAHTGAGLPAWLGTRIATTLIWYVLLGPVINRSAEGAKVTTGGLLIATVTATVAVLIGVALGLSRWPARQWLRVLVPAAVGAACAHTAIWVSMRVWTHDMNYEHIRRLDWLIVLCGALLVSLGMLSRPRLLPVRTKRNLIEIVIAIAVVAATLASIRLTSAVWSPAQQMPSVISAEQVTAPLGADLAFALNGIGPDGGGVLNRAEFAVTKETGQPVPASTRIAGSETATNQATLRIVLRPDARPMLCESIQAAKLTIRDRASGMLVQAVVPDGWCTR